jgi:hypothetical protein
VAEELIRQTPEQEAFVRRDATELGEARKGAFFQAEVKLPPGFELPSATLTPPAVQPTVSAAGDAQAPQQAPAKNS